jgi:hypothetical protein
MLDAFLEVACEHEKKASAYKTMVADMKALPKEELYLLAEGKSKLAYLCGDSEEWLEKYEGTPFHEQALQLEQAQLEHEIACEQRRLEERTAEKDQEREDEYQEGDALRLKKRILDLQLNKWKLEETTEGESEEEEEAETPEQEAAEPEHPELAAQLGAVAAAPEEEVEAAEPEEMEEPEEEEEEEEEAEPAVAAAPPPSKKAPPKSKGKEEGEKKAAARMRKAAAVLTQAKREKVKSKNFAVPKKGGEGKYPIPDATHARNALTRVRQFGSPSEKSKVYSAVAKKYPALATRSSVIPESKQRKAEKKLGLPKGGESEKKEKPVQKLASTRLRARYEQMQKEALGLGALGGALKGGLGALRAAAPEAGNMLRGAVRAGSKGFARNAASGGKTLAGLQRGVASGAQNLGMGLQRAVPQVAQWAQKNPQAALGAAGIGAAGLGAAGLGAGFAGGRMTAPRRR